MSNKVFLVCGVPLSNMAWYSNLLITARTMCYYEPLRDLWKIHDLDAKLESDFYSHVGVADSALSFFLDELVDVFEAKVLVLERNPDEVSYILEKAGLKIGNYAVMVHERLQRYRGHDSFMYVPWNSQRDGRMTQRVFWHCLPDVPFDEDRYRQLAAWSIEPTLEHIRNGVERSRKRLTHLLANVIPQIA